VPVREAVHVRPGDRDDDQATRVLPRIEPE